MTYGDKRDYRKIDLSVFNPSDGFWHYRCSTTWARTCREARERLAETTGLAPERIRARFSTYN